MAAETIAAAGPCVTIFDSMPSAGRKLLMAGRGGLNLTKAEPPEVFAAHYGEAESWMTPMLARFGPDALQAFVNGLGQETFVGSSRRVFPKAMKASPLLRAWLAHLSRRGVRLEVRHRWLGFADDGGTRFATPAGEVCVADHDAVVLALGGASWPRLGSDGGWVETVTRWGVHVTPLTPANAGIAITWSPHVVSRFAGSPLKRVRVTIGEAHHAVGELVVTATGLEGGPIYALSPAIAAAVATTGRAEVTLDLRRDLDLTALAARLSAPRGKQSVSNWLRKSAQLPPVANALLREAHANALPDSPEDLARAIKHMTLITSGFTGLDRAISTAGGISRDELDDGLMLLRRPGVFAAGEMLDWQAPTGGYLLQGALATGRAAGEGVLRYLRAKEGAPTNQPQPD